MSVAADTTNHDNGSRAIRESPLREAGRGMDSRFRGNDEWWGGNDGVGVLRPIFVGMTVGCVRCHEV